MGIVIKKESEENWIYNVSSNYVVVSGEFQDFKTFSKCGRVKEEDLCGLELEKEYKFYVYTDFDIIERISQVKHEDGFVYDDLFFRLKDGNI
jgi:hypothetical protein